MTDYVFYDKKEIEDMSKELKKRNIHHEIVPGCISLASEDNCDCESDMCECGEVIEIATDQEETMEEVLHQVLGGENAHKLFWVTTEDHDEDWFILARNEKEATIYHEDYEGYDRGDATATLVCPVQNELLKDFTLQARTHHPSEKLIKQLGGVFVHYESPYVVRFGEDTYVEGGLDSIIAKKFINVWKGK